MTEPKQKGACARGEEAGGGFWRAVVFRRHPACNWESGERVPTQRGPGVGRGQCVSPAGGVPMCVRAGRDSVRRKSQSSVSRERGANSSGSSVTHRGTEQIY